MITDVVVIDLSIRAAREGRQTHTDLLSALLLQGMEPMTTSTSNAAEKSAKRRMG